MARKRRRFSREFKIEVIREIEQGNKQTEVYRKHGLHPVLVNKWRKTYHQYPETAFQGNGKQHKDKAKIAELEHLVEKLYVENGFFKNVDVLGKAQKNGSVSGGREVKYQMMQDLYFDSLPLSRKAAGT